MAVPGSVVGVGKLITPGGQQGPKGDAGTASNLPLADITQNGLLRQTPGLTTSFLDGTNNYQSLVTAIQPTIWSARLRSFSSLGNPNFEVTQRNCRGAIVNPTNGVFIEDRWLCGNNTLNPTFQGINVAGAPGGGVMIPGTNFVITQGSMRISVGTQKTSLAAGDHVDIGQQIEGSQGFRELMSDVHSIQILCRSSVANLKFGIGLRDPTTSRSLTKLCTLGAANTTTLIALPNLPLWPSAGTFTPAIGSIGYLLNICVAAGSTFTSPANDAWQNGNFLGALGQDNLLATAGATFDVFMVQHEPGSQCTTLQDKSFQQNYDESLRYYQKTTPYSVVVSSSGTALGCISMVSAGVATPNMHSPIRFHKPMAKTPTLIAYSVNTGAANNVRNISGAADVAVNSYAVAGDSGFGGVVLASSPSANSIIQYNYSADTGW